MSAFYWCSASVRRLLTHLFLFSLLLALLSSAMALYNAYRTEYRNNEALLQQIRNGYLPSLAQSVWSFDIPQVESQLAALVQFPYIRYAMLDAGNGEHFSAGKTKEADSGDNVLQERQFDLYYHNGERSILVGSLHLQLDLAAMRQQVMATAPAVLLKYLLIILLLAVLLLLTVIHLLRRHTGSQLRSLSDWAERGDLHAPVPLLDDGVGSGELNRIGCTINHLCQQIQQVTAERDHSDCELQQLNNQLKQKVEERTGELNNAINSLNRLIDTLQEDRYEQIENEKMAQLGSLVAGVAHELNTPLGICVTARSYIEDSVLLIQERVKNGTLDKNTFSALINNISEGLLLIDENLNRSHRLVCTFKSLAVDEESDFRSRFSLEEFLQEFSGNNDDFFVDDNTCRIEYDLSQPVILNTCRQTLGLVMGALIGNSLDHGYPDGGDSHIQIHASIDAAENLLTLIYEDDGIGISHEVRQRIFDPFFTTGRHRGKTGLGMHLTYNLVTRILRGNIEVCEHSNGAEIKLRIPLDLDRYDRTMEGPEQKMVTNDH